MQCAQNGDKEAFQTLFADIGPLITRFVRRRMHDQSDIEDVCQETLLAIFRSRHTFQPTRPFEPWLYAIVRNVSAAYFERNRQHRESHERTGEAPEGYSEDESSLAVELRDGLNQLTTDQIEALELTKVSGFSITEAALRAGTSASSMKVRVHRAYVSLKRSMQR